MPEKRWTDQIVYFALLAAACGSHQRPAIVDPGLFLVEDSSGTRVSYLLGSLHIAPYSALPRQYIGTIEKSKTLTWPSTIRPTATTEKR